MSVGKRISKNLRNEQIIEQIQQQAGICIAGLANAISKKRVLLIS
jgi:hypothetical protein